MNLDPTQAVYEKVRAWFSKPDAVYGYEHGKCVYRGGSNPQSQVRCSVGAVLDDSEYEPRWDEGSDEESGVNVYAIYDDTWPKSLRGVKLDFLDVMQNIHDNCANENLLMSTFIADLDGLASKYGLKVVTS